MGRCFVTDAAGVDVGPTVDAVGADACASTMWFRDRDGDDYGVATDAMSACVRPEGYVAMAGDCNDASAAAHPGVSELCNRADDDCDGASDEGLTRVIGEPVVIATDNPPSGQVGILSVAPRHVLLWSESAGRNIVSSAIGSDGTIRVAPHILTQGFPFSLHALTGDEALLVYKPAAFDSTELLARRMSTVFGDTEWISEPVVVEDAPECCRFVTTGVTDERIVFTWRTEARPETFARSCARDLTDCTPRVTLFSELAFIGGIAGGGPNPVLFFAATLPGDVGLHTYADRIDARTLARENLPVRVNAGVDQDFPMFAANNLVGDTAGLVIADEVGAREFVRFTSGIPGTEIRVLGRTPIAASPENSLIGAMLATPAGFELISDGATVPAAPADQVNWESFTQGGVATAPVTWTGPRPTSVAVAEGGFLRSEEPARLVFQRTGCE